jgi:hypothetical protein
VGRIAHRDEKLKQLLQLRPIEDGGEDAVQRLAVFRRLKLLLTLTLMVS